LSVGLYADGQALRPKAALLVELGELLVARFGDRPSVWAVHMIRSCLIVVPGIDFTSE
jgi:hypothetical protein